jgi:hypothetical protein
MKFDRVQMMLRNDTATRVQEISEVAREWRPTQTLPAVRQPSENSGWMGEQLHKAHTH